MGTHPSLVSAFAEYFLSGEGFATITEARRYASEVLGVAVSPGTAIAKQVDEAIESGIVRTAQSVIQESATTDDAYDRLVELHHRQPALTVRSSTSVLQQAYSTPLPIAYLASTLAGITPETTVYEPTAGHGALLMAANPANATVNELNPDRAADLIVQGYSVTQHNAADYQPDLLHDVVIANPPFGPVKDEQGHRRRFKIPGNRRGTTQIDQAIAFRALGAMKPDGRAVLILGGKTGLDQAHRSEQYNSLESRGFFYALYQQYGVRQHFTISGELYRKQGAGFPIDVIVIEGRGPASRPLPAADVPHVYTSFSDLKEQLPHERLHHPATDLSRIRRLFPRVETQGGRGPESISNPSALQPGTDEPGVVPPSDGTPGAVADSRLDQGERGRPTPNRSASQSSPGLPQSGPRPTGAKRLGRIDTPGRTGMVRRVGIHPDSPRSHISKQVRDNQWQTVSDAGISALQSNRPGGFSGRARLRNHPGELAELSNRRYVLSNSNMATPDTPSNPELTAIDAGIEIENDAATRNVIYAPRSRGTSPGTLIPANMAASAQKALDVVEQRRGNVDEFVCDRLGYDSHEAMWRVLYAEQIDSLALAFDQRDQSKIFLNGDQTGNGKGRFGAANIIDVQRQGLIPVFVTRQPNLYNAMINDLADIGKSRFTPFATNNNLDLTLDDGRKLKTGDSLSQEAAMQRLIRQGGLGSEYDAVFTTYTQLQTIKNKEPLRRDFLRALAPRAVFIFDESHEAGGSTGDADAWKVKGPKNRAEFVRELIDQASGAVFLSATATKDPAVMDLYARRSDAIHAVSHMGSLKRMLKAGGIPLQQMMATKFVASGQLLRRERSFENISFDAQVVPVNRAIADGISDIMRAVDVFDRAKGEAIREIRKQLKQEAKQLGLDNAIGQIGVQSTNFTSLMHNAIDQGLLSQKAEATVQTAVQSLQQGEKPLIALASTMDAFIKTYTDDNGIELGDSIDDISFGDVLYRYLERSRDVVVRDYEGFQTRRPLTDDELGADAIAAYDTACELITETDLSEIPLSSIDYIKWRLGQEGYSVDEITGRENIIDYDSDGQMSYARRPSKQTSPQGKIEIVNRFNGGELDVVILNRSGSTGINLHASEKFADQRLRHMIVVQAERDINQVMQMLGRANRFGQVVEPRFTLLMSDLPAEKRLGALLAKKMASLNANTTASRDSDLSVTNVVDFMNVYGEAVITEILEDDLELEAKLSFPSSKLQGNSDTELISRVTGRIPLLPIEEQEALYARIETETQELIAQKQAMGENVLAAEQLDLDARTIAQMEVIPEESTVRNEFTGSVYLDVVDAKIPVKPPTQLQVINAVRQTLDLEAVPLVEDHDFEQVEAIAHTQVLQTRADLLRQLDRYRDTAQQKKKTPEGISKLNERLNRQRDHVITTLATFVPGTSVQVASPQGGVVYGVVTNVWQKGNQGSPAASTNWRMQILTANQARQVTLPLSKVNTRKDSAVAITPQGLNWDGGDIYTSFDLKQSQLRQEAQIFTGNLLRAFEKYPKGQFLNYTDNQGRIRQGLMMPAGFDIEESLRAEPVAFREPYQVKAFLTELTEHQGAVKSLDEVLVIKSQKRARYSHSNTDGFVVQTPKATSVGGRYFLDEDILAAVEGDFYSVSDRMEVMITEAQLERVLEVVMQQKQITLAAFDLKETAREYLGEELPSLELVESAQYAEQGHYVPHVPEPTHTTRLQLEGLLAQEAPPPSPPQESPDLIKSPELTDSVGTAKNSKSGPTSPHIEQPSSEKPQVLRAKEQKGGAEKQVAKFLHEAGLAEAVLQGEDFHLRIENEPFIPLVVERHGPQMYLAHYLTQNGDMFIDAEMVFQVSEQGHLRLQETAVQLMGGEHRNLDRGFAQMFARNINHQGFAEAAQAQLTTVEAEVTTPESSPPVDKTLEQVTEVPPDIQQPEDTTASQPDEGSVVPQSAESTVQATGPPESPQVDEANVASPSENTVSQEVEKLRDWYRAARDLGREPAQLEYIKALGQSAKEVNGQRFVFPQAAQHKMTQDLEQYQVYRQRGSYVAQASHFILGAIGQLQGDTKQFQGTIYELEETTDTLTVRKRQPQPQVILRVRQDQIHRTMVTAEDCQKFKSFVQRLNRDLTQQKRQWHQSNAQTHTQQ